MSRFATFSNSVTTAGSTEVVAMRDMGSEDDRGLLQIDSSLGEDFKVRIFATLNYDFDVNTGGPYYDITKHFDDDGDESVRFEVVDGIFQRRKNRRGDTLREAGIYALDVGFFPAAIFAAVETAPQSGHLDFRFGF